MRASLMLLRFIDAFIWCENSISHNISSFISVWGNIWVEWVVLQVLLIYSCVKLYNSYSYLRQVLTVMCFVILTCLYLSVWQLELFGCFLFLGEFTILIFIYCLYLHLRASVSRTNLSDSNGNILSILALTAVTLMIGFSSMNLILASEISSLNLFIDLYKRVDDFSLNDLVALYYFFTAGNITIHAIIGLMLFFLTLFLFSTVTAYTSLHTSRLNAFRSVSMKLNTPRGYYEQAGKYSQKYFNHK